MWPNKQHFWGDITKLRDDLKQNQIEGSEVHRIQPLPTESQLDQLADRGHYVHNLEAQIDQKDKEIKRLRTKYTTVHQESTDQFQSMVKFTRLVAEEVQKIADECGHSSCHDKFQDTIKTYERNIRYLNRAHDNELRKCKNSCLNCQDQPDIVAKQIVKIQALHTVIAETEAKLQNAEEIKSVSQRRYQELTEKAMALSSQLHVTKSQLDESNAKYHDQFWPLHTENAKMKAEIISLKTSRDGKKGKILDLKRLREEYTLEKDELEDKIKILEKQRTEAAARAESWRLKWQDLKVGKDRAVMYSDPSGDVTMIDPPGAAMKVDIPWVLEAGQENIKLRLEIESLTERLEEAKEAAIAAGKKESDQAIDFRLKFEAAERELKIVKKDLDVAVKDYLGVLQDIEMDPTNLYHPIYKKMEGLRRYIKESEEQNALLKAKLEDEKTRAWDRRTSMVECLS